jgi:hypothetical protein
MFAAFLDAHALLEMTSKKTQRNDYSPSLPLSPVSTTLNYATNDKKRKRCKKKVAVKADTGAAALLVINSSTVGRKSGAGGEQEEGYIGSLTISERREKVQKYLIKRRRMLNNLKMKKSYPYKGRTRFANARRRVKGRFVTLEFMQVRGIKFDSEKPGWVCSSLGDKVFRTADAAVKAVDAANGGTTKMVLQCSSTESPPLSAATIKVAQSISPMTASSPSKSKNARSN